MCDVFPYRKLRDLSVEIKSGQLHCEPPLVDRVRLYVPRVNNCLELVLVYRLDSSLCCRWLGKSVVIVKVGIAASALGVVPRENPHRRNSVSGLLAASVSTNENESLGKLP